MSKAIRFLPTLGALALGIGLVILPAPAELRDWRGMYDDTPWVAFGMRFVYGFYTIARIVVWLFVVYIWCYFRDRSASQILSYLSHRFGSADDRVPTLTQRFSAFDLRQIGKRMGPLYNEQIFRGLTVIMMTVPPETVLTKEVLRRALTADLLSRGREMNGKSRIGRFMFRLRYQMAARRIDAWQRKEWDASPPLSDGHQGLAAHQMRVLSLSQAG